MDSNGQGKNGAQVLTVTSTSSDENVSSLDGARCYWLGTHKQDFYRGRREKGRRILDETLL